MAESTSLLRTHTRKGIEGSNPSLSEVLVTMFPDPLHIIHTPADQECAICLDKGDGQWAYHTSGKQHPLHLRCWRTVVREGFNCPFCNVPVELQYIQPGKTPLKYRIAELIWPRNGRLPVFVKRNWKVCVTSSCIISQVIWYKATEEINEYLRHNQYDKPYLVSAALVDFVITVAIYNIFYQIYSAEN